MLMFFCFLSSIEISLQELFPDYWFSSCLNIQGHKVYISTYLTANNTLFSQHIELAGFYSFFFSKQACKVNYVNLGSVQIKRC